MGIAGVSANIQPPLPTPPLTEIEPPEPQVEPPAADPPEPVEAEDSGQRAAGVLRKLQEGHFKGVADVRLRINFHEEIAAAEAAAAASATSQGVDDLTRAVNAVIDQLGAGEALTGEKSPAILEAQETFNQAVSDAAAATLGAEPIDGEGLIGGLQEAFDSLVTAIEAVFAEAAQEPPPIQEVPPVEGPAEPEEPPAPDALAGGEEPLSGPELAAEPPGETVPPPASADEPEETPPDALQTLRDAFEAALATVEAALIPQSSLPPLSEPMGNGVAYEKFLTMYEALLAPEELASPPVEAPIDITA